MASRKYAVSSTAITNTANATMQSVDATASTRVSLYELLLGCTANSTMTDDNATYRLTRSSGPAGGGNQITPMPLDGTTPASAFGTAPGARNGTYTTKSVAVTPGLTFGLKRRATFRWIAAPGSEIMSTASTSSGVIVDTVAVSVAYGMDMTFLIEEA